MAIQSHDLKHWLWESYGENFWETQAYRDAPNVILMEYHQDETIARKNSLEQGAIFDMRSITASDLVDPKLAQCGTSIRRLCSGTMMLAGFWPLL